MKKIFKNLYNNKVVLTGFFLVVFVCAILFMYKLLSQTLIYVEFDKLRPFHQKAPVYFRGYKIGKVLKIQPDDNYQKTLVTIVLYPQKLKLPINTTAHLKMHKTKWLHRDYIDLVYPNNPDNLFLKRGAKIKGKSSVDMHSFLASISHETYEKMEENAAGILENLNDTTGMLYSVFAIINGILTESENDIKFTMENFAKVSKKSEQIMQKIDNSIAENQLKKTFDNIEETSLHAKTTFSSLTQGASRPEIILEDIDKTLFNTNSLISNINELVCGIKHSMKKRFFGLRLFLGKILY